MEPSVATGKTWVKDILVLTALIGLLFGVLLGARFLQVPDEGRYVEIPREMGVLHDFVTPHINFIKYFEKPPLVYWLEAAQIKLFGLSLWSIRIPNALIAVLGCLMTYVATRKIYGRACGILAAFIQASSLLYFLMAHALTLDMTLSVLLSGSLLSFWVAVHRTGREKDIFLWAMYGFAGLAVLTKGLVGIILPGLVIFVWTLMFNEWKALPSWRLVSGALIVLAIALPWHVLAQLRNPEFFQFYVLDQQFLRYFTGYANREQALWFLPSVMFLGFLPWTFFAVQSWVSAFPKRQEWRTEGAKTNVYVLLWAGLIYGFFQASHSQLMPYVLPVFPALSILMARYFCLLGEVKKSAGIAMGLVGLMVFALGLVVAMLLILAGVFGPPSQLILGLNRVDFVLSGALFVGMTTVAALAYWRQHSIPHVAMALVLGMGCFSISVLVNRAVFEQNSSYPLAQVVNRAWQPGTQVFMYEDYFQDLPVYLQHPLILVGERGNLSELTFGAQHQNMEGLLVSSELFWKIWQKPQSVPVFVAMSTDNYDALPPAQKAQLNVEVRTNREVLATPRRSL